MNRSYIAIIVGIIVAFIGTMIIFPMSALPDRSDSNAYCEYVGGDWWDEESVCRNISAEQCETVGGTSKRINFRSTNEGELDEMVLPGWILTCDLSNLQR